MLVAFLLDALAGSAVQPPQGVDTGKAKIKAFEIF